MAKLRTIGEQLAEKALAKIAAAKAAGKPPSVDLAPEDRRALAQDLGREPDKLEEFTLRLSRDGDGGHSYDRLRGWVPPMAQDPDASKPLQAEIKAAEARLLEARLAAMSDEEREVFQLKATQAALIAQETIKTAHADWLADTKVAAAVERLKALDAATALDPSWDWPETVAIARALAAFETVGVDQEAALRLADDAFTIEAKKRLTKLTEHEKEIARLKSQFELEKQALAEIGYSLPAETPPTESAAEPTPPTESGGDPSESLWQQYETDGNVGALHEGLLKLQQTNE